jgi:hypothetical protein
LPDGVFIIVTSRPNFDDQLVVRRARPIYVDKKDPHNQEDVRTYIALFLAEHREKMGPHVAAWGISEGIFFDILADKSEGNFMYLVHVLDDIRTGRLTRDNIGNIQNLPQGLIAYYKRHWAVMQTRDEERFTSFYEPVVDYLGAACEPVSAEQLAEWTRLSPLRVREAIRELRPFLSEEPGPAGRLLYRIYHASFLDFLRDVVGLEPFHQGIANTILSKIPSFRDGG